MVGLLCPLMKECKLARPLDPDAYPNLKIFFKQFQINSTEIVSEIQKIYRKKAVDRNESMSAAGGWCIQSSNLDDVTVLRPMFQGSN